MLRHRRARAAFRAGDFAAARRILEPGRPGRLLAQCEYLLGDYAAAERIADPATLALIHYRAGRFDRARDLDVDLPIVRLMRAFDRPPYALEWAGGESVLSFLQTEPWDLPTVAIEIDGRPVEAWIDTGGDLLTLPAGWGIEPLATFEGTWTGAYGRVDEVRLGGVTVRDVPVATGAFERPVIGTNLLARFLPTIDYPGGRLVLRPPDAARPDGAQVPFAVAATHLLIVRGALGDRELTLLVDSGLRDEQGAAFTAPAATLKAAGIPRPALAREASATGAGTETRPMGRFAIPSLRLGPLERRDLTGLLGAFPPPLRRGAGFPIHGLISHGFLREWAWTLDFERRVMSFAAP